METTRVRPLLVVPLTRSPRDDGGRAGDGDLLAVEVDVGPAEVEQFAAPGSGVGGDVEEGEQPVLLGRGQERPELGDGPDGARLVGLGSWPLGSLHRVAADDFVHDRPRRGTPSGARRADGSRWRRRAAGRPGRRWSADRGRAW